MDLLPPGELRVGPIDPAERHDPDRAGREILENVGDRQVGAIGRQRIGLGFGIGFGLRSIVVALRGDREIAALPGLLLLDPLGLGLLLLPVLPQIGRLVIEPVQVLGLPPVDARMNPSVCPM